MRWLLLLALAAVQLGSLVSGEGFYTIVGPGTIRSNYKYTVALTLHEADEPTKFEVGITGPSYNKTELLELPPLSTKSIDFDVPKLESGNYNLTIKGLSGMKFENSTSLEFADKIEPSVYIQTDKATYKPGDLVRFRIIFLDENTRPAKIDGPISLSINDGVRNRIKQLDNIKPTKGVYSSELQLSEQPVLGTWSLDVAINGQDVANKNFDVDKYVLPKFDVKIETASNVAIPDGEIKATIRSTYTYGKPVKGTATVSIEPSYFYYGDKHEIMSTKTIPVNGKGHVSFIIDKDLKLNDQVYTPPLKIFVVMTEELTGNQYNASAVVNLHRNRYRVDRVSAPDVYTPDEPFVVKVAVKHVDDSPVTKTDKKVTLKLDSSWMYQGASADRNPSMSTEYTAPVDSSGIATFKVTIPASNETYFWMSAIFEDANSHLGSIRKFTKATPSVMDDSELKIETLTEKPRLGKDLVLEVKSKDSLPYFIYTIVARGNIMRSEQVKVPEGEKSHKIKIVPTFEMIPRISVFVYYVQDKNLRFDEKTVDFEKDFENSIDISAPAMAKPGEDVPLSVHTDPGSYVGLLGVDQSVLLLKSGNDFDRNTILNKLSDYDTRAPWTRGFGRVPGTDSGLVAMTNASFPFTVQPFFPYPIPIGVMFSQSLALAGVPVAAAGASFSVASFSNSVGSMASPVSAPVVRKDFSESWIFVDQETTNDNGSFTLNKKIPDTITSWVVTGFSLNPKTGFGITKDPTKVKVFQPFFVSTNLPYSVKRGEVIAVPVIIFNYLEKTLDTDVTMDNIDGEYDFTEATNEVEESEISTKQRTKRLSIPANSGQSVSFMIRPKIVGDLSLKITAISPLAGDSIIKKLKVEPEGIKQYGNEAVFITLKDQKEQSGELKMKMPEQIVPDSEYIELSVVGDLLGPTLKNLDKLVRMPYGCGEQNMVNFVPNILVLKYLEAIGRKMPTIQEKAKKFVEIGYQRELTYKHDDGSYSAFGKSDKAGSTWLTAYVIREFHRAKPYTFIDPKVLEEGFNFLISKQAENGSFPEYGHLFDNTHQNELGLTAFVLIALLENEELEAYNKQKTAKAADFIAKNLDKEEDLYSLALAYIALQKMQHPSAKRLLERLEPLAKEENGLKWWSKDKKKPSSDDWYSRDNTNNVEITAYIFLALITERPANDLLPIVRWLISQRNSNGGFSSTQDTIVGLYALSTFAEKTGSGSNDVKIDFSSAGPNAPAIKDSFQINQENALVLNSYVLPKSTREVSFKAQGSGSALIQLAYQYNIMDKDKKPNFKVDTTVESKGPKNILNLQVCAQYVPQEETKAKQDSNMAVLEIDLPSGYTIDSDKFQEILDVDRVKRTETKNDDSSVIVYFESLTPNEKKCLPVQSIKTHAVAKQKPAAISIYDYYDPSLKATDYYQVASSLCDICEGEDCGQGCQKA